VIAKWIPTIVVVYIDEYHECRSPPASIMQVCTTRTPPPVTIEKHPTSVVIGRPTPRFITYPSPTVRWTPNPVTITIGCPISVDIDGGGMRSPDPAIVGRVSPIAVGIKIFSSPYVLVVILNVVPETLRQIALAVVDPFVNRVEPCIRCELPVAGGITRNN